MPQGSSPMWFGVAAGLHLGNFRAVQFGFFVAAGLTCCKLELQLRKPDT